MRSKRSSNCSSEESPTPNRPEQGQTKGTNGAPWRTVITAARVAAGRRSDRRRSDGRRMCEWLVVRIDRFHVRASRATSRPPRIQRNRSGRGIRTRSRTRSDSDWCAHCVCFARLNDGTDGTVDTWRAVAVAVRFVSRHRGTVGAVLPSLSARGSAFHSGSRSLPRALCVSLPSRRCPLMRGFVCDLPASSILWGRVAAVALGAWRSRRTLLQRRHWPRKKKVLKLRSHSTRATKTAARACGFVCHTCLCALFRMSGSVALVFSSLSRSAPFRRAGRRAAHSSLLSSRCPSAGRDALRR